MKTIPEIGRVGDIGTTRQSKRSRNKKHFVVIAVIAAFALCFILLLVVSGQPNAVATPPSVECPIPEFPTALIPVVGMFAIVAVMIAAKRR